MKISFILKFKNEGESLKQCVESLLSQEGDFDKEFIFVNDNSNDESIVYAKDFIKQNPNNTKLINLEPNSFTYASSANIAIPHLTGELTCIITVHTKIANNKSLQYLAENFEDTKVAGVYSRSITADKTSTFEKLAKQNADYPYKIIRSEDYMSEKDKLRIGNYTFIGTFCLIRTEILKQNYFHELPRSEDLEWAYRIMKKGYKIVYEPRSEIVHFDHDPTKKLINRWLTSITAINLILLKKAPSKISLLKSAIISWTIFMLRVTLKEPELIMKLKYFRSIIVGQFYILRNTLFDFSKFKKWEEKYKTSLIV